MLEFDASYYIQAASALLEKLKSDNTISEHTAIQIENEYLEKINFITTNLSTIQQNTIEFKNLQAANLKSQNDLDLLEIKLLSSPKFAELIKDLNELQQKLEYHISNQCDSELENVKLVELCLQEQESLIELKRQQRELLEPLLKSQLKEFQSELREKEQEITSRDMEVTMKSKEIEQINKSFDEIALKSDKLVFEISNVETHTTQIENELQSNIIGHRSITSDINKQDQITFDLNLLLGVEQANKVKVDNDLRKQSLTLQQMLTDLNECTQIQADLDLEMIKMEKEIIDFEDKIVLTRNKQESVISKTKSIYKDLFTEEKKENGLKKLQRSVYLKLIQTKESLQKESEEVERLDCELRAFKLDNTEVGLKTSSINHQNDVFVKNCVDLTINIKNVEQIKWHLKDEYEKYSKESGFLNREFTDLTLNIEAMLNKHQKIKKTCEIVSNKIFTSRNKLNELDSHLTLTNVRNEFINKQLLGLRTNERLAESGVKLLSIAITKRIYVIKKKTADISNKEMAYSKLKVDNNLVNELFTKTRDGLNNSENLKLQKLREFENATSLVNKQKEVLQAQRDQVLVSRAQKYRLSRQFESELNLLGEENKKKSEMEFKSIQLQLSVNTNQRRLESLNCYIGEQLFHKSKLQSEIKTHSKRLHSIRNRLRVYKDMECKYYKSTDELESIKRGYLDIQDKICSFKVSSSKILINVVGKDVSENDAKSNYDILVKACTKIWENICEKTIILERSKSYLINLETDYFLRKLEYLDAIQPKMKLYRTDFEKKSIEKSNKAELKMLTVQNNILENEIVELRHKIEYYEPATKVEQDVDVPDANKNKRVNAYIPNDDEQLPRPFLFRPFVSVPNAKVKSIRVGLKPVVI
eukprot:NODE_228_length_13820_cov_0.664893.p2 type:complete len:873 gc:universal NODE_228_length_13820_cov_0.664893:4812-2194(-)